MTEEASVRLKLTRDLITRPPQPSMKSLRVMTPDDQVAVAEILFDAYRGGVDDEGDGPVVALVEVVNTMAGQYGPPIPDACLVGLDEHGQIVSAVLTVMFEDEPLIAHVVTDPDHQHQGWGGALIEQALQAVAEGGGAWVNLAVTVGNPALALYEKLGFLTAESTIEAG